MLIRLGYEIAFRLPQPTPMLVTLSIHDSRRVDIVISQELRALPSVPMRQYRDSFGNTCTRLVAPAGYSPCTPMRWSRTAGCRI